MTTETFLDFLQRAYRDQEGAAYASYDENGAIRLSLDAGYAAPALVDLCPITFVAWTLGCGVYHLEDVQHAGSTFGLAPLAIDDIQDAADYPDTSHRDIRTRMLDILGLAPYAEDEPWKP